MIDLQLLFELELVVEELAKMKMLKTHEQMVAEICHSIGKISGCILYGDRGTNNLRYCQRELLRVRMLSKKVHAGKNTRQVSQKLIDLLGIVGSLESQINHEIQKPGLVERVGGLLKSFVSIFL
jgi:hypothetical protein